MTMPCRLNDIRDRYTLYNEETVNQSKGGLNYGTTATSNPYLTNPYSSDMYYQQTFSGATQTPQFPGVNQVNYFKYTA